MHGEVISNESELQRVDSDSVVSNSVASKSNASEVIRRIPDSDGDESSEQQRYSSVGSALTQKDKVAAKKSTKSLANGGKELPKINDEAVNSSESGSVVHLVDSDEDDDDVINTDSEEQIQRVDSGKAPSKKETTDKAPVKRPNELDMEAIAQGSDDSEQFIGRTVFENDSNESREDV